MYTENLTDPLVLLQSHKAGLSSDRHAALETFEPPGNIAFEALQAAVGSLSIKSSDPVHTELKKALLTGPAHLQRDIASPSSIKYLSERPEWRLTRSLTIRDAAGVENLKIADHTLNDIENLAFHGGDLDSDLVVDAILACPNLTSLDLSTCSFGTNFTYPSGENRKQLKYFYGLGESDLQAAGDLALCGVSCVADEGILTLLSRRTGHSMRDLCITGHAGREGLGNAVDALLSSQPLVKNIERLTILADIDDVMFNRMCQCYDLTSLQHLAIQSSSISGKCVKSLFDAAFTRSLVSLDLSSCNLGRDGWEALAQIPFNMLESLKLNRTRRDENTVLHLDTATYMAQLRHLEIAGNNLGPSSVKALALGCQMDRLEVLDVRNNEVTDDGARMLSSCSFASTLRELRVNGFSAAGMLSLSSSPSFTSLESLTVGFVNNDELPRKQFSPESPLLRSLRSLSVTGTSIDDVLAEVSENEMSSNLRRLLISGHVTDSSIAAMTQSEVLSHLWVLGLTRCPLGDKCAQMMAGSSFSKLNDLRLVLCDFTATGSRLLAGSYLGHQLRWLSMEPSLLVPWLDSNISGLLESRISDSRYDYEASVE